MSVIIRFMSTWTGKTLGNVIIGELIARGGMAEVYFGSHTTLNRNVAVKIMRDHVEEDPDSRARFTREARVVASLNHNQIIQIFDYALVDGRPCIVMELVPGASLGMYLKALQKRGEKLPRPVIVKLMRGIASAIDYAHEQNIVHRDIKPANILLRSKSGEVDLEAPLPEDVEPVLTDFGLVRLLDSSTQTSTGTVSGTPAYMSPEQARGDKVERQTDIYSLGVVLYELLAGCVPFDAESSFGVLMKHLNEPPPPITGISKDMQAIIDRALAKDPAHRYNSAGEMVNEFASVLEGKSISQETKKLRTAIKNAASKTVAASRLPLVITGVVLAVTALVLAGVWIFRPQAVPSPQQKPDQPVGRVIYSDANLILDKVSINITGLPAPKPGTHYEVWLLAQGGEERRSAGPIIFDGEGGHSSYTSPNSINLLSHFDQVDITIESDTNEPDGNVVASSIFPPMAFNHVRHILVSISSAPDGNALIQGLWWTADSVDTSTLELKDAFANGDEEMVRLKTEEIINQLAGDGNKELYKDWNNDGEIADLTDGYGLLPNGNGRGYIPQTMRHAQYAASAPDATQSIMEHSAELIVCTDNMQKWNEQLLTLALKLQKMPFGPEMESMVADMIVLSGSMLGGVDANGNKRIEPISGEGGADTAYEFAFLMAEMPLLPGSGRVPPPVKTP
ncbi:hypothetical protein MASR2M66_06120 [Chloroflexota bacterium]